jgi:hypothetical protein
VVAPRNLGWGASRIERAIVVGARPTVGVGDRQRELTPAVVTCGDRDERPALETLDGSH